MNWRTDPPNGWTALYRIVIVGMFIGLYGWVGFVHDEPTVVGQLIAWLLGAP